ncbi:MAG: hypothetical protein H6927_05265 [Burkholderiaceae bacterium]|jgi:uncharacterized pyridoxal phosphate-containing UPF0001 family protein|nr:hypothetical protein [Pseudomonadota bacterium]MBS0598375.1 hypothetical protein [Pseudomonadota bacterium]MCP5217503.1 hypothetical protein [Burkholderiaceae bacterium]
MTMIAANLQPVRTRIATAGPADGRNVQDVALLAVPKTFGPEAVRAAWLVAFAGVHPGPMVIAEFAPASGAARAVYMRARAIFDQVNATGLGLGTLSLGMSQDLEAAMAARAFTAGARRAAPACRP